MEVSLLREMVVDSHGEVDKKSSKREGRRESPA
jgi:hypothetical protein